MPGKLSCGKSTIKVIWPLLSFGGAKEDQGDEGENAER
jgi:hypothetical protein